MRSFWYLLIYGKPKIASGTAIEIIKQETLARGWQWRTPVKVFRDKRIWVVWTNLHGRGSSVWGEVDCETGEIKTIGLMPR